MTQGRETVKRMEHGGGAWTARIRTRTITGIKAHVGLAGNSHIDRPLRMEETESVLNHRGRASEQASKPSRLVLPPPSRLPSLAHPLRESLHRVDRVSTPSGAFRPDVEADSLGRRDYPVNNAPNLPRDPSPLLLLRNFGVAGRLQPRAARLLFLLHLLHPRRFSRLARATWRASPKRERGISLSLRVARATTCSSTRCSPFLAV